MKRKTVNSFEKILAVAASAAMTASLCMPMTVLADEQSQSIQEAPSGGMTAQTVSGTIAPVDGAIGYTLTSMDSNTGQSINTAYGSIQIDDSGNYSYTVDPSRLPGKVKCSLDSSNVPYVDPDGPISHLPLQDSPLVDTVSVNAVIGGGQVDAGKISVSIQGVNYAPYAFGTPETMNVSEDGIAVASGSLKNVFSDDAGFSNLKFTVNGSTSSTGTFGKLILHTDGTYEYDLDNAAAQQISPASPVNQSFTITATDKYGASANTTLNLIISGENDSPEISTQYTYVNQDGLTGMFVYRDVDYAMRGTSIVQVTSAGGVTSAFDNGGTAVLSDIGTFQLSAVQPADPSMSDWEWYSFAITPDANIQAQMPIGQSQLIGFQFGINDGTSLMPGPSLSCSIPGTAQPATPTPATPTPATPTPATPTPATPTPIVPVPEPKQVRPAPTLTIHYQEGTIDCTAAMEYSIGSGMQWQNCQDNMQLTSFGWDGTSDATVYFRLKATETEEASDAAEIVIKARSKTPDLKIDYQNEAVNCTSAMEYSIGTGMQWQNCQDNMQLTSFGWDGTFDATVYFRYKASDSKDASDAVKVTFKTRPAAPYLQVNTVSETAAVPAGYSYGTNPNNVSTPGAASVSMKPEAVIYVVKDATDQDFRSLIGTVTAPKRAAVPTVSINFNAEILNISLPTQYSLDGGSTYHDSISGMPAVSLGWTGGKAISVLFRNPASDTQYHSDSQVLTIPARPGKPNVTVKNESSAGKKDGEINGVSAAMEVRSSGNGAWSSCSGSTFGGLSAGSYQVRIRATGSGFCSESTDCAIADQSGFTRILSVDNIVFATAAYGYAPYQQQTFRIKNSGNSNATIFEFRIDGSDDFDLQGLKGAGVPAGYELNNWSIAPKPNLAPGTHTGTLVLVYDNGAVCTASISFTVTKSDQAAPSVPVLDVITETSISIREIPASSTTKAAAVYSIDGGRTWQDSTVFNNLNSGVTYSIIARYAQTDCCNPSAASAPLSATTVKSSKTPGGNPTPGTNPTASASSPAAPTDSSNPSGDRTSSNLPFILIISGVVVVAAAAIILVLRKGRQH